MKNNNIIDSLPKKMFRLKEKFGGILTEEYGIYTLDFDNSIGKGNIKYYTLSNNITVLDFDVILNEEYILNIGERNSNNLYFAYCTEGLAYFKAKKNEKYLKLEELQPGVIGCNKNTANQINIKKEVRFVFNLITVDKDQYFNNFTKSTFVANKNLDNFSSFLETFDSKMYLSASNLKISDKLRVVRNENIKLPISGLLKIESTFVLILALHLEQLYLEIFENNIAATLSKSELQKIRLLTEYIIKHPELQHSINSLCSQISMSPAKLQEGFKSMHNTTVADFVRNIRIDKAEKLLIETDLNISEIVYTIGLTSRSYFCKIFKSKFNCSPKRYRKLVLKKRLVV